MIDQTISYRIIESSAAAEWVASTRRPFMANFRIANQGARKY
jgi:hypothetical protein